MTASFLQSELSNLVSESKRKHVNIKNAAETSLAELKTIAITSETQLAGDLLRRPQFIDPFLLACQSQHVKLASTGTACLQRLIASTAIPRSRLLEVLRAVQDAVPLALEVQLKILQILPSLLQLYAADVHGESLAIALGLSAELSGNKLAVVSNTAAATFQQLVSSVFERISQKQDQSDDDNEEHNYSDVNDAAMVFRDICALLSGAQPKFVRLDGLSPSLVLETIENLLSNHGQDIIGNEGSLQACHECLIPGLMRLLEKSNTFGVVARAFRITFLLSTDYFEPLKASLEQLLLVILSALDRGVGSKWKRALCLEFFRGICSDFEILKSIFSAYDQSEGSKSVVSELMATMVRIASEDPSLIGLGRQSTIPTNQSFDETGDATAAVDLPNAGTALGGVAKAGVGAVGVSAEWSTISSPCLDQFDRATAPDLPDTYVYTLVLGCVAAISEGLSKFIMPLSVPNRKQVKTTDFEDENDVVPIERSRTLTQRSVPGHKYQQLINPLTRSDDGRFPEVQTCSKMIEDCWPAVLAICSTFLNAALDSYFYHILVRTVQKLAQVSGVLELNTPRDALLTTLAKVSVPINVSRLINYHFGGKLAKPHLLTAEEDKETNPQATTVPPAPSESFDLPRQSLNVRNLLCLRAILNLGIALGPTLSHSAWVIVLQSLQQVEALMSVGPNPRSSTVSAPAQTDSGAPSTLASEITAVETATRRMMESTKAYSNPAFSTILKAVLSMADDVFVARDEELPMTLTPAKNGNRHPTNPRHQTARSVSGNWTQPSTLEVELRFVLKTIAKLSSINIIRFSSLESAASAWETTVARLLVLQGDEDVDLVLRLQTAHVIDDVVVDCAKAARAGDDMALIMEKYALPCLQQQLKFLPKATKKANDLGLRIDMHQTILNSLESVIGQCGDSLQQGWSAVFDILYETVQTSPTEALKDESAGDPETETLYIKIIPVAFRSVQLIISDFLQILNNASLDRLIGLLSLFGTQNVDLNMALTATALYWNLITLLLEQTNLAEKGSLDLQISDDETRDTVIQTSHLWRSVVTALAELCNDRRSDVRTGAVRMLLRTLDASSQYLSPNSLSLCIGDVLVPLIELQINGADQTEGFRLTSLLQLIEGTATWMQSTASLVTKSQSFSMVWEQYCQSLGNVLGKKNLSATAAVYSSICGILSSLALLGHDGSKVLQDQIMRPVWILWTQFHPADIQLEEASNETALTLHTQVIETLSSYSLSALETMCNSQATDVLFDSVSRTAVSARHSQYTNDINKLSGEQERLVKNLVTIRRILERRNAQRLFCDKLLDLIAQCLAFAEQTVRGGSAAGCPRGLKRPNLAAFLSECFSLLKDLIITAATNLETFSENVPVVRVLQQLSNTASRSRGESVLPDSTSKPIRRNASVAAVKLIIAIQKEIKTMQVEVIKDLGEPLDEVVGSLITSQSLDSIVMKPSTATLLTYENEDVSLFHQLHEAAQPILQHPFFLEIWRQTYILTLFHSSLASKPWFGDMPEDLIYKPLKNLEFIRPGSLRGPDLPPRRTTYIEALRALLGLISEQAIHEAEEVASLAIVAAPYVLLRIAHPLKAFMADQRLRYLNPPHPELQKELRIVLTEAIELRSAVSTFQKVSTNSRTALMDDGKTHLRLLFPLVAKFHKFWRELPRLDICAWQEDEDGCAIEGALTRWNNCLNEGWEIS